jgi:hypothetical protein
MTGTISNGVTTSVVVQQTGSSVYIAVTAFFYKRHLTIGMISVIFGGNITCKCDYFVSRVLNNMFLSVNIKTEQSE